MATPSPFEQLEDTRSIASHPGSALRKICPMQQVLLDEVCVLKDNSSTGEVVLAHAREWACSLSLPLQVLDLTSISASPPNGTIQSEMMSPFIAARTPQAQSARPPNAQGLSSLTDRLIRPGGLSFFSSALPYEIKRFLVSASLNEIESATLICSPACRSISRVLILHGLQEGETGFLHSALSLCRLFEATPVILTLASNETRARQDQRIAEEACLHHQIPALLDYVVGLDSRTAVCSIARWRRCSHVFMPRRQSIPWWKWPRRDNLRLLLESDGSLSFLALPESGIHTPETKFQSRLDVGSLHSN